MRNLFGCACFCAAMAIGSTAQAQDNLFEGMYLRGDVGLANVVENDGHLNPSVDGKNEYADYSSERKVLFSVGAGLNVNKWFRTDLSFSYRPNTSFSGDYYVSGADAGKDAATKVSSSTLMLNGHLELHPLLEVDASVKPYLSVALGAARHKTSNFLFSDGSNFIQGDTVTNFAWGAGGGMAFPINERLDFDLSYMYQDLGTAETGTRFKTGNHPVPFKQDINVHNVMVGLRYSF